MKPGLLLTLAGAYLVLVGLGFLLAPDAMLFGALGNASVAVVAALRGLGGALLGVATVNLMARDSDPSNARDAIFLGNTVGFGLSTVTFVLGLFGGSPAPGWVLAAINALIAIAFFVVGKANMSKS